jgi:hypothetical protein
MYFALPSLSVSWKCSVTSQCDLERAVLGEDNVCMHCPSTSISC